MKVKYKKIKRQAVTPTAGSEYSAGLDLYNAETIPVYLQPGENFFFSTGLIFEIPEGYFGGIFARSGLACKNGLRPANCVGVIDSDYRGEVQVCLYNDSPLIQTVNPGDRIAQMVIMPYLQAELEEDSELSDTDRGEGGFGSTGV